MKFVSKSSNLNIILRAGIEGEKLTGRPATPAIFIRFRDGIANVENEDLVEMMLAHPGCHGDFIPVEDSTSDPYRHQRSESEPQHIITEMAYGMPSTRLVGKTKTVLPPELMKLVQAEALQMFTAAMKEMKEQASVLSVPQEAPEKTTDADVQESEAPVEPSVTKKTTKA